MLNSYNKEKYNADSIEDGDFSINRYTIWENGDDIGCTIPEPIHSAICWMDYR